MRSLICLQRRDLPIQGKTIVRTHLLPEDTDNPALNQFAAEMNPQLKQIVDFAAEQ